MAIEKKILGSVLELPGRLPIQHLNSILPQHTNIYFYFSDHSSICHVNNLQYFDVRQDYSVWANFSDSNQSSEYVTEAKFGQKISWRLSIYYIWVPPQRTWERFKRCITQFCTESQHSGKSLHLIILKNWQKICKRNSSLVCLISAAMMSWVQVWVDFTLFTNA